MTAWAWQQLGARVRVTPAPGWELDVPPVEIAVRYNPKRVQLLVSRLLGKHIPVAISDVERAGRALAAMVATACASEAPIVVGFAETATALGHVVAAATRADGLVAAYAHTTRRRLPGGVRALSFREEHSHAVGHQLWAGEGSFADRLASGAPLVLVDDELSTGRFALNAIRALHAAWPRERYLLASLVDSRDPRQRAWLRAEVAALGAGVDSVSLYDGEFSAPPDIAERASALVAPSRAPDVPDASAGAARVATVELRLRTPVSGWAGWGDDAEAGARAAAAKLASQLDVAGDERTLVLGDEELMYLPQLVAAALGPSVRVSATTRSPAVVLDTDGYPLRTGLAFAATDDPDRASFAYNVAPSQRPSRGNAPGFDHVVFVTEGPPRAHVGADVVARLAASARDSVKVVTLSC